ncbi:metallophosphoesterase family protein [Hymenobacter norwichensis]|uniref:metallophosphoesterase family protein n=1 Tax=Hymenobacter norwichensis TaxID=223903 RepID=UPI0003B486CF|nr:metallophosphoesterase [Hymenobacter norwichensis]
MKAQIQHFSEPKNSMIQSAVNERLNLTKNSQGLNSQHPHIHVLNKVLELRQEGSEAGETHESLVQRALNWVKDLVEKVELTVEHSNYTQGFAILEQYVAALLTGDTGLASQKRDELKFSGCDPKWVESMVVWFNSYKVKMDKPQYVAYTSLDDYAYELPPTATGTLRVGIIGDWGTGEHRAVDVLTRLFALKPDLIIHLGDIYYSGTEHEYEVNFHAIINQARQAAGSAVPVYNLPGNHDYYSGGHAFYESLQTINTDATPGTPVQQASYFALYNNAWQIQGMDTGLFDNDVLKVSRDTTHLKEKEVVWHQHQLDKAQSAGRKVILLSHHQLFSRYQAIANRAYNAALLSSFQSYLQNDSICAWFWGHEHIAAIYKPYKGLAKGRCLGHGGVPVLYDAGAPYAEKASVKGVVLPDLPEVLVDPELFKNNGEVYYQGFALLELHADKTGTAHYYTTDQDKPIYEEDLC